jgi:hypothetical protein
MGMDEAFPPFRAGNFPACAESLTARDLLQEWRPWPDTTLRSASLSCVGNLEFRVRGGSSWPASFPCQRLPHPHEHRCCHSGPGMIHQFLSYRILVVSHLHRLFPARGTFDSVFSPLAPDFDFSLRASLLRGTEAIHPSAFHLFGILL